jgi:uncharacterized protein involved in exopolysaccharide biosynthesis
MESQIPINESSTDDEIDLLDLVSVLLKRKALIIGLTLAGMVFAVAYSVISLVLPADKSYMKNEFTPEALMLINDSSSSGGSLSSLLSSSSGLSSLASLAGISAMGGSTYSALAVYLIGTNDYMDSVVDHFDLITRYKVKKSPRATSRQALTKNISAEFDSESGVLSISFTDSDPVFAQSVVNYSVEYLEKRFAEMGIDKNKLTKENLEINMKNSYAEILKLEKESQKLMNIVASGQQVAGGSSVVLESKRLELELSAQQSVYTQLKTQYEVLKVQMASESPVFQVLEYAEVPDQKSGPSRGMLCIIVTFTSFFGSVFLAFLLNAIENIRKDPVAMAKLRGAKK